MAAKVKSVDAPTAKRIVDAGAHIVDVRREADWAQGHIEGSDQVAPGNVNSHAIGRADAVVVVDATGHRSKRAAKKLAGEGYVVYHLTGGLAAWHDAGLPLASTNGGRPKVV